MLRGKKGGLSIMITDMTKGKPLNLLLNFTLPLLIGNIFQQLYNFVDTIVVGRFVGPNSLAAVGSTGAIMFFMNALIFGLNMGAGIVVSQFFGAKRYEYMKKSVASLAYISSFVSVIITFIGVFGARLILKLLKVPEEILGEASLYMKICCGGTIFMAIYSAAATILRSVGDSKTPFYAIVLSSVTNIICNLLFVLLFRWGTAGVAIGTVLSQFLSAILCVTVIIKNRHEIQLYNMSWHVDGSMVRVIFNNGMPGAMQSAMIALAGISVQGIVNSFGTSTMAAYAAVQRIDSIAIQFVVAIASSLSVFTGQNIGSGNLARIKEGLKATLFMMMIACISIVIIVVFAGKYLLLLFLDAEKAAEAIRIAQQYLTIIGIAYIISGFMNSYLNLLRGAGDVKVSLFAGIAEVTGRIVFATILVKYLGTWGIWIATPCSWFCGCLIPVIRYYKGNWKKYCIIQPNKE